MFNTHSLRIFIICLLGSGVNGKTSLAPNIDKYFHKLAQVIIYNHQYNFDFLVLWLVHRAFHTYYMSHIRPLFRPDIQLIRFSSPINSLNFVKHQPTTVTAGIHLTINAAHQDYFEWAFTNFFVAINCPSRFEHEFLLAINMKFFSFLKSWIFQGLLIRWNYFLGLNKVL